jgi:hypothetical protein
MNFSNGGAARRKFAVRVTALHRFGFMAGELRQESILYPTWNLGSQSKMEG